jgi:HEAT repeat protein
MAVIHIKKIQKKTAGKDSREAFAVTAVGITTPQGKMLIPNPAGKEALLFDSLEEAEAAIRRAGFDYEYQGRTTYLHAQAASSIAPTSAQSLEAAVPVLIQRLKERESTVVANSAFALGMLRAVDALDALVGILGHDDASVRKAASEALARLTPHSIPVIRQAFETALKSNLVSAPYIRLTAMTALFEMTQMGQGQPVLDQCLSLVIGALEDESWLVRAQAALVVGQLAAFQEATERPFR